MWLWLVVAAVALQRMGELALARRNTRRLLAAGAREAGRAHYPLIVCLHAAWLIALIVLADPNLPPSWSWLALFLALQAARIWVVTSLGERWTTRVLVLPDSPLVRRGPYRWCRHPNYIVVQAEIVVLPLAFHLPWLALGFGIANAAVLAWRIRVEDRALGR